MIIQTVSLEKINLDISKFQFRTSQFNQDRVDWLVDNWSDDKVDPIDLWLNPEDGKLYLISGHHRVEAAKRIKKLEIISRIHEFSLAEAQMFALTSNANRLEYTAFEKSKCLAFLIDVQKLKLEEAAQKFPMSKGMAKNFYSLKFLIGTSWEIYAETKGFINHAFELGLFCNSNDLSIQNIEYLFTLCIEKEITARNFTELLKEIKAFKCENKISDEYQESLFNIDDFAQKCVKVIELKSAKVDLALQTWWIYELVNNTKFSVPDDLKDRMNPLIRELYAYCVDSPNKEEIPQKSVRKKMKSLAQEINGK